MTKKPNSVRIISGKFKSRTITFPDRSELRPTGNRIREVLFDWLQFEIAKSRCLDLFAGSGALGIESLSRGAESATFIESDHKTGLFLQDNLRSLGVTNGFVCFASAIQWLERLSHIDPFDIVFLDPPFKHNLLIDCCKLLEKKSMISEGGFIYIETDNDLSLKALPLSWRLKHERRTGNVAFYLYRRDKKGITDPYN